MQGTSDYGFVSLRDEVQSDGSISESNQIDNTIEFNSFERAILPESSKTLVHPCAGQTLAAFNIPERSVKIKTIVKIF